MLHGMGDDEGFWTSVGRANLIMDNLLADGKTKPAIIVMPFGHPSRNIAARRRGAPRGGVMFDVAMLEKDLKENVVPMIEKEYSVNADRNSRAIAGLSMGGYQAMASGLNNLPMFAYAAGFSSALVGAPFDTVVEPFLADPAKANKQLRLLWLGVGGDDGLLAANQKFEQLLSEKGIRHEWTITPGYAHWWTLWRAYLYTLLPLLFM
jgi:enterochelin esterase-like enzyme